MKTIAILVCIFSVIDVLFYFASPYPERKLFRHKLPGGGIVAYFKLRRKL